jgi:hypothetical protein
MGLGYGVGNFGKIISPLGINVPFLISSRVALAMTTASLKDGKS